MKMNKTAAIISACVLTFGLSACSSNYVMHTAWGNKQQINRSDVKQLGELDN